ncbi:MAG: 3-deoxy-D-manno-octulosonic acid transferase [Bacteroidales bacterium]
MMNLLYNASVAAYSGAIRLASLWNEKARLWVRGRKDIFKRLQEDIDDGDSIIWFHAASLGEFEQGRPIIERCRAEYPECEILLTFFSPSGFEIRKNFSGADYIYYLPIDTPSNVRRFLDIVNPRFAVFIKYEFWMNYISGLKSRDIPLYIVSAKFRKSQHFFKPYGFWFRKYLKKVSHFFVQDTESLQLLHSIGIKQVSISGDTRFDRVSDIVKQEADYPLIEQFVKNNFTVVCGSTWPKDEENLKEVLQRFPDNFKLILVPHEIHSGHLNSIESLYKDECVLYSKATPESVSKCRVLVIDAIGFLSKIYRFGQLAYIGGGFGVGIHNTLEAAVYGMPILIGPKYKAFREANYMVENKIAYSYKTVEDLICTIETFRNNPELLLGVSKEARNYVKSEMGATNRFFQGI